MLPVLVFWAFERFYLRGNRPGEYPPPADPDTLQSFTRPDGPGPGHLQVSQSVRELATRIAIDIRNNNFQAARAVMDSVSDGRNTSTWTVLRTAGQPINGYLITVPMVPGTKPPISCWHPCCGYLTGCRNLSRVGGYFGLAG